VFSAIFVFGEMTMRPFLASILCGVLLTPILYFARSSSPFSGERAGGIHSHKAGSLRVATDDPRLNSYQNILTFGGKGDGDSDNSIAFQDAINAGHAVMIPEGVFNFKQTIQLKKDSVIVGVGRKSILRYTGSGAALQETVGSYEGGYNNLKLMNFTLTTTTASQTGVELTNNYHVTLSGLYIDGGRVGFATAGVHIIGGSRSTNSAVIRILDGEIWFCMGDGVRISGPGGAAAVWIERNHISGNGLGVNQVLPKGVWPSNNFQIINNVIEGNIQGAIVAHVLYASSISGNYFENIDGSRATPVSIGGEGFAQGVTLSGNIFGGKKAEYNIDLNGAADFTGVIANNIFAGASIAAIRVATARGLTVENNTLEPGTTTKLIEVGPAARSIWIQDAGGASFQSGGGAQQPDLRLGGRLVFGAGAALAGGPAGVEIRTLDGAGYSSQTALTYKLADGPSWSSGSGAPASPCVRGSLYSRLDGEANTTLYICDAAGWIAK
jgi:hypothetical protein